MIFFYLSDITYICLYTGIRAKSMDKINWLQICEVYIYIYNVVYIVYIHMHVGLTVLPFNFLFQQAKRM